ncbi:MAG: M1 family metallopeptidase [Reichenbachiella sp.]|uniref:M1 family metallopeptidase n=1 Tax=Reichenbachiella sp. TaxID=2184521 RepID=UPI003263FA98
MLPIKVCQIFFILACTFSVHSYAQGFVPRAFDVLHYQFEVELNDTTDVIQVVAEITLYYPEYVPDTIILDLAHRSRRDYGMEVSSLLLDESQTNYEHLQDQLRIFTPMTIQPGDTSVLKILYSGRPDEGLVISKNSAGQRTFFSEHWPNRAHRWLSVVDHPSEKATCEFSVVAPIKYDVISNGIKTSEVELSKNQKKTVWEIQKPIPSKVMVIGVAEFKTETLDPNGMITVWAYDKPRSKAVGDFSDTPEIFELLYNLMGSYPYTKCDQVESTTRFGGMENAGNIFYPERALTGRHEMNQTIAHEIAHQWFGNSLSEAGWEHVWISEGISTYLAYYYLQELEGEQALLAKLEEDEEDILNYQFRFPGQTVVQKNIKALDDILNPMTYEKAAWVLRMLEYKLGSDKLNEILVAFYERYQSGNASTEDFIAVASEQTNITLDKFFHQWFYVPGNPNVDYNWRYKKDRLVINFHQVNAYNYQLDFEILLKYKNGKTVLKPISLTEKDQTVKIIIDRPVDLTIDPSNIMLGEFHKR